MRKQLLKDNLKSAILVKVDGVSSHSFAENHTYIGAFFQIPNIPFEESDSELVDQIFYEDTSIPQYLWNLAKTPMYEFRLNDEFQLHFHAQESGNYGLYEWQQQMDAEEKDYDTFEVPAHIKELIVNDEEFKQEVTSDNYWENFESEGRVEEGLIILFAW